MRKMSNSGYDVLMISADDDSVQSIKASEGCQHESISLTRNFSIVTDLIALKQFVQLCRKYKPTIIHTHTPKAGIVGMLGGWICRIPLRLHTVAGLPPVTQGIKGRIFKLIESLTFRCATHVLPNSNSLKKYALNRYPSHKRKMDMIGHGSSNGVSLKEFSSNDLEGDVMNEIKESIDYNEHYKYLLSIGRIVKSKGIEELVNAYKKLDIKGVKLVLLGKFETLRSNEIISDSIKNEILNNKNIIHIDWTDNVKYFLSLADVLIHPSHREGFPNVLLQAGAMQCPIVCSRIVGNVDLVSQKNTGLLFEKGNMDEIKESLEFAINNPEIMQSYALNLYKEIQTKFSRKKVQQEYLNYYNNLLITT